MVRTLPLHCRGPGFDRWSENSDPANQRGKDEKKKSYSKEVHLSQGFWKRSELQFLLSQHPSQHPAGRCFKAHQFGNHEVRRPKHLPCLLTDSTCMRINVYGTALLVSTTCSNTFWRAWCLPDNSQVFLLPIAHTGPSPLLILYSTITPKTPELQAHKPRAFPAPCLAVPVPLTPCSMVSSVDKNPAANAGDTGLIPSLGRFHMPQRG